MTTLVHIDGRVYPPDQARVSVFDRGFLYGDSVYEVLRTSGGHPVDLERHLDRLALSARRIYMEIPPADELEAVVRATLHQASNDDSYVRVMVTRGEGPLGLDPALADRPRVIVLVKPLALPPPELYAHGAHLAVVDCKSFVRVADPLVKSGNYLKNVLALADGRRSVDAYEVLLRSEAGRIVEGATSNVFLVGDNVVTTPPVADGLLDGITRRRVLELASAEGIEVREHTILEADLPGADEAFITSSIRGVLPVATIDGRVLGPGTAPGPVTKRLMDAYDGFLSAVASRGSSC